MPAYSHQVTIEAPLERTWDFVKDMGNWAALLPGYEGMTVLSDTDSEWKVRGDLGILSKLETMRVHVTEWVDLSHVEFTVVAKEDPLQATGRLGDTRATLGFDIDAEAGGMLGPVVNALLNTVMPRMAGDFADAIKRKIENPT